MGCGAGEFARILADKSSHVLRIDLSPNMIQKAKEQSKEYSNIDYGTANVMEWDFPNEYFDCIASIATLHHLPLEDMLSKIKKSLRKNGVLLVLDLYQKESLGDILTEVLACPINMFMNLIKNGYIHRKFVKADKSKAIWDLHSKVDHYLTLSHIREICDRIIPNARVRRHLFWRYSIICKKR